MAKGFWSGVLATAVGGIILFAGTQAYTEWRADREHSVDFSVDENAIQIDEDIRKIVSNLEAGNEITFIEIKNSGFEDIEQAVFRIRSEILPREGDIIDFGIKEKIGDRVEAPTLAVKGPDLVVTYPILRPGEGNIFWLAHESYEHFSVSNTQAGVRLNEINNASGDDGFWGFVMLIGAVIGSLILGIVLAEWGNRSVLRKLGFDPEEISLAYQKELLREKEQKKSGPTDNG